MAKQYDFKSFFARESPFHDEYVKDYKGDSPNLPTFRINKNMLSDLENHFKNSNMTWTEGMSLIIHEYLDRVCRQRRTFNHLEVIMLIPKTDNIDELVNKSKIISFINTETDFNEYYQHKAFDGEYNLVYELKPFDELNFPLNIIRETKDSCVINTSKENCDSFEKFKASQKELYSDFKDDKGNDRSLDVDDCYFVRFPINNYLDSYKNGEYHHGIFDKDHLGIYFFHDPFIKLNNPDRERKLICIIDWHYLYDISKIEFSCGFSDGGGLIHWIQKIYDDDLPQDFRKAIFYAVGDKFSQLRLKQFENHLLEQLEIVRSLQNVSDD